MPYDLPGLWAKPIVDMLVEVTDLVPSVQEVQLAVTLSPEAVR